MKTIASRTCASVNCSLYHLRRELYSTFEKHSPHVAHQSNLMRYDFSQNTNVSLAYLVRLRTLKLLSVNEKP